MALDPSISIRGKLSPPPPPIDWAALRRAAQAAAAKAYVPYSEFRVGAAALVDDGRVISGCNVENASYGLTLCAECTMIGELFMGGGGRLRAVVTVGNGADVTPCGRCRQLLWEHGGAECQIEVEGKIMPLAAIIPFAFPEASTFEAPGSARRGDGRRATLPR